MKILCVCDEGNNRSVNLSSRLKYWGNDSIPIGLRTTTEETLKMLFEWADKIICTDSSQKIPENYLDKYLLFDVGEDVYPRPYNCNLDKKIKYFLEKHKDTLKNNL